MADVTPASVAAFADYAPPVTSLPPAQPATLWKTLRRDRTFRSALAVLGVIVGAAIFAPLLAPYDPAAQFDLTTRLQAPSAAHWFGTDPVTRDVDRKSVV